MISISYWTAFVGGILVFFSPCVLPLLPLYLGYLAGETIDRINEKKILGRLLTNSLGFILGLSLLNLLMGFGAKFISDILLEYKSAIRIIGGMIIIMFGLYFLSGRTWLFLEKERRFIYKKYSPNFWKSFILGFTFSMGWTSCNGPIVAQISLLASFQKNYLLAGTLMLTYSAGFSVFFFLAAIFAGKLAGHMKGMNTHLKWVKRISGILMILIGILMVTNKVFILG